MAKETQLQYGSATIGYSITYQVRKTLSITVTPEGHVRVVAPEETTEVAIRQRVFRRAAWILRQQERFRQLGTERQTARRYVSGETHYYMGRQYRLRVAQGPARVQLKGGWLTVTTADCQNPYAIQVQLADWYRQRAIALITPLFQQCLQKLPLEGTRRDQIVLKWVRMKNRWGSCSPSGIVRLNPDLIKTPKACIEYIIWHELAHLVIPNHNRAFYALQSRLMPDWPRWQQRLAEWPV